MTNNKWFYSSSVDQHGFNTNAVETDGRFYIVIQGADWNPYITYYDKNEETWSSPVLVGTTLVPGDGHGAPAMCRDNNGYLHIFYGCHDSEMCYKVSTNPDDISAWTDRFSTLNTGKTYTYATYPIPFVNPVNNDLYLMYRKLEDYNWYYKKSTTSGGSWSAPVLAIESIYVEYLPDLGQWSESVDGSRSIHFCWVQYNDSIPARENFYYSRFNIQNQRFYDVAGNDLGASINDTIMDASCKVFDTNDLSCWSGAFLKRGGTGTPLVIFNYETSTGNFCWSSLEWNGTTWSNQRFITTSDTGSYMVVSAWEVNSKVRAFLTTASSGGNLDEWEYDWDGRTWSRRVSPFQQSDCPHGGNGWRVIVREPTDTRMMVFQEVGTTPYVVAAAVIGDDDVPRYLMDKYTKRMYFQAMASPPPKPSSRPNIEINDDIYGDDYLSEFTGAGITTTTEEMQHIFDAPTAYSYEATYSDFQTDNPYEIFPMMLLDEIPSGSPIWYENEEMEYGLIHQGWHKTFITPPLKEAYTFSERVGINLNTAQQYKVVEGIVYSSMMTASGCSYPRMRMYVWRGTDSFGGTLLDDVSTTSCPTKSDNIVHTVTSFFERSPMERTITASAGDRLAIEIITVDNGNFLPPPNGTTVGPVNIASHVFAFGGSNSSGDARSYIEFVTDGYSPSFSRYVTNRTDIPYNLSNGYTATNIYSWDINGVIVNDVDALYSIRKQTDELFWLETSTTLAGRCSLRASPDTIAPDIGSSVYDYYVSTNFYKNRYQEKRASLNKYFPIDDFENYYTMDDISSSWVLTSRSEIPQGLLARKTFSSPQDFTNYNIVSLYTKADNNTLVGFFYKDVLNYASPITWIPISKRAGRYEFPINQSSVRLNSISSVNFLFPYRGDVWIDDIVLLDMRVGSIDEEWIPINLVDLNANKQAKINTIKIPYKRGETIQHHGEYSAKGSLTIRSMDNRDTYFLAQCEHDRTNLYLRAKNAGIPLWLMSHQTTFKNYSEKGLKSEIVVNFAEIYNQEY